MSRFQVDQPILNSPYEEPREHWELKPGETPVRRPGRRSAVFWYRPASAAHETRPDHDPGTQVSMILVNEVRRRVAEWRSSGFAGATRTTLELLQYWRRDGRRERLFFAQLEAAETIFFLHEARSDLRQGLSISLDKPSTEKQAQGYDGFRRYACKMATGSGKTTVMAMVASWSILNKLQDRRDARFADAVLVICPNVTIRTRLQELDPQRGDSSLYRTRDLVPPHLLPDLARGRVLITNWHVFEPREPEGAGPSARVVRAGEPVARRETIKIGSEKSAGRGRTFSERELEVQLATGQLRVLSEQRDAKGRLQSVEVESWRYLESDQALVRRVLGTVLGSKQHLLVMNDEAHHAYRIARPLEVERDEEADELDEEIGANPREATVWIEGLDRIHKLKRIHFCLDLSATPYFPPSAGTNALRPFPWVVSDFGLTDAIESGLVKIPQLAVRDTTGAEIPGYANIWRWMEQRLTATERGGKKASPKPEAILKWSQAAIASLGALWEEKRGEWARSDDPRPPVFIVVCKNTQISKVLYEWIAEGRPPFGIPEWKLDSLRNQDGEIRTLRVDTKVVGETDSDHAASDDDAWMRLTLDTVGKREWPADALERPLYPPGFVELADKRKAPLHPPGRDIRCILSVGMLTEGWDCNTVTHIVGLRPFVSQLLCEQVVGRALRRRSYQSFDENGLLREEVAQILGVPFEVIPLKKSEGPTPERPDPMHHVHALPERAEFEIRFPRVEGYRQAIANRVRVDWDRVVPVVLDSSDIPPVTELKSTLPGAQSRPSLFAPGGVSEVTIEGYSKRGREQSVAFEIAKQLAEHLASRSASAAPMHVLFPQLVEIAKRFLREKVQALTPYKAIDIGSTIYFSRAIENLAQAIQPDVAAGELPELPRYEASRGPGSTAEVDSWTSKDVREIERSHLNYVVADTKKWEQSAAYVLDRHELVECFAKNAGLNFSIPYLHNGEAHDYLPDFLVRFALLDRPTLILETKGYDVLAETKRAAAMRWVEAVNAEGSFGRWAYVMVRRIEDVDSSLRRIAHELESRITDKSALHT